MDYLTQFFELTPTSTPLWTAATSAGIRDLKRPLEGRRRFGSFELTDAVRPTATARIVPSQGFRYDKYVDDDSKSEIPVIMAAASREVLFALCLQLIQKLGPVVDVVLETSHDHEVSGHRDLFREQIDTPVLTSTLMEFEDLLLNDGCTGIAVLNPRTPQEVQFDEHKLMIMYGNPLENFEEVLERFRIRCQPGMHFITEAEHIHASNRQYRGQFEMLCNLLGTEEENGREMEV